MVRILVDGQLYHGNHGSYDLSCSRGVDMPSCIHDAATRHAVARGHGDPPRGWGFVAAIQGIRLCHPRKQQGGF